jgi:Spy/CpxP family protein refolding chaperone
MADECGLSDEQKSRIARKVAAMRELEAEEKKESAQIVEKLAAAYQEKDNDQANRLRKEMGYLRDAARKVSESLQADILAVLTPSQRAVWETAQLQRRATLRYRQLKFDLTDPQRARLRQACQEQGQELAEQTRLPSEAQIRSAMSKIDQQVLTAEQRRQASMLD